MDSLRKQLKAVHGAIRTLKSTYDELPETIPAYNHAMNKLFEARYALDRRIKIKEEQGVRD